MAWGESGPASEFLSKCEQLAGQVVVDGCSRDGLVGACLLQDDYYSPDFYFYENYAGGLDGWPAIEDAEASCGGGSSWSEP